MSRDIDDLLPAVTEKARVFLAKLEQAGIQVLITCTYRSALEQDILYLQGRTRPGKIITNARGWQSWHNYRRAFDIVPIRYGKPVWGTTGADLVLWQKIGKAGEDCGLEWAGRWKRFKEFPHFQDTGGMSLNEARAAEA